MRDIVPQWRTRGSYFDSLCAVSRSRSGGVSLRCPCRQSSCSARRSSGSCCSALVLALPFPPPGASARTPLVADSTGANITIKVDLTNWFRTSSGTLIDPATANAGGTNAALVSSNIARSFKAFRDDDHDGRDDHGGDDGR